MTHQQMETIKEQIMGVTQNQVQAFPCAIPMSEASYFLGGMSLRDWFAGQIAGEIYTSRTDGNGVYEFDPEETARKAYAFADAMMEFRKSK